MRAMELDSIECVSYSDGMEEDDDEGAPAAPAQLPRPFLKSASTAAAISLIAGAADRGGGAGPLMPPATGVHELLECPVCTNSMYPPIHQVPPRPAPPIRFLPSDSGISG
jgi:E3 ubiquitin-protein ligase SIAH1